MNENIDNGFFPEKIIPKENVEKIYSIQRSILESYAENKDNMEMDDFLAMELKKYLPEEGEESINKSVREIISSVEKVDELKVDINKAIAKGRNRNAWFSDIIVQKSSYDKTLDTARYMESLDEAMKRANSGMQEVITTKGSEYTIPNMNPNLDGFIVEQHNVNSFNKASTLKGSDIRAEVLRAKPGQGYTKNSVDMVVKDGSGKIIQRYQAKYGKDAKSTINMIKNGKYDNQRLLVPPEQVDEVKKAFPNKTVTSTIEVDDIKGTSLTKKEAKKLQKEAQNKGFLDNNLNEYTTKDLALGISREIGYASMQSAVLSSGVYLGTKFLSGENIKKEEVIEQAIITGADTGVKCATAAGLKIASDKGLIPALAKGTKANVFSNIAYLGIENVKIWSKVASGEMTVKEAMEESEKTAGALAGSIMMSESGVAVGASLGLVFGPIGATVGGFVGGMVGAAIGSKVGRTIVAGAQKVRKVVTNICKTTFSTVKSCFNGVRDFLFDW